MSNIEKLAKLANRYYLRAEDDTVKVIHDLIKSYINIETTKYKTASLKKPTVIVCRHGATKLNSVNDPANEMIRSWIDCALVEDGVISAERLGQYFLNFPISHIITSDLQRAYYTALPIQRYTNVNLTTDVSLRPFNLGAYSGKPVKECIPALIHHIKNIDDVPERGTESFRQFLERFYNTVKTCMNEAIQNPDKAIILVAHSRNTRAFRDFILEGNEIKVEDMKMETLLQEKDPTPTGHFVAAEYDGQKWNLVDLPGQDFLVKENKCD